jgi:hypothetical protein
MSSASLETSRATTVVGTTGMVVGGTYIPTTVVGTTDLLVGGT